MIFHHSIPLQKFRGYSIPLEATRTALGGGVGVYFEWLGKWYFTAIDGAYAEWNGETPK